MITLKFLRWENIVCFQVLEMDEKYRFQDNTLKDNLTIYEENAIHKDVFKKIKIISCAKPEIHISKYNDIILELYLRGDQKNKDKCVSCFECEDDYTAKIVVEELEYAIRKINEKDENKDDIDIKIAE